MRSVSWFLVAVLVIALGILIGSAPPRNSHPAVQEAADVQLNDLFVEVMIEQIIAEHEEAPYAASKVADKYTTFNNEMERSEDRTVYFAVVNSSHSNSNRLAYRGGPYPLMCPFVVSVATEHKFMYTTATTEEVPFPLKGPYLAGRFTDILTEALVDLRSPT
jgi:hypothetical protein